MTLEELTAAVHQLKNESDGRHVDIEGAIGQHADLFVGQQRQINLLKQRTTDVEAHLSRDADPANATSAQATGQLSADLQELSKRLNANDAAVKAKLLQVESDLKVFANGICENIDLELREHVKSSVAEVLKRLTALEADPMTARVATCAATLEARVNDLDSLTQRLNKTILCFTTCLGVQFHTGIEKLQIAHIGVCFNAVVLGFENSSN